MGFIKPFMVYECSERIYNEFVKPSIDFDERVIVYNSFMKFVAFS